MADPTLVDTTNLVQPPEDVAREVAQARALAERYLLEFVDMGSFRIDQELFRSIPADLMLRYGFVPMRREGRALAVAALSRDAEGERDRDGEDDPEHSLPH